VDVYFLCLLCFVYVGGCCDEVISCPEESHWLCVCLYVI
jgi:hypothetical protein